MSLIVQQVIEQTFVVTEVVLGRNGMQWQEESSAMVVAKYGPTSASRNCLRAGTETRLVRTSLSTFSICQAINNPFATQLFPRIGLSTGDTVKGATIDSPRVRPRRHPSR